MLRLLQWLFLGHSHKWKIVVQYETRRMRNVDVVVARGHGYTMQCEGCGRLKEFDTLAKYWYL